jgi:hypothetical protein
MSMFRKSDSQTLTVEDVRKHEEKIKRVEASKHLRCTLPPPGDQLNTASVTPTPRVATLMVSNTPGSPKETSATPKTVQPKGNKDGQSTLHPDQQAVPNKTTSSTNDDEEKIKPEHLKHDFDLIDLLHKKFGHTSTGRLQKIIKGMAINDTNSPSLKALHKWSWYRKC